MKRKLRLNSITVLIAVAAVFAFGCGGGGSSANSVSPANDERATGLLKQKDAVARFFQPMHVEQYDWLKTHPEDGQTFAEYLKSGPTLPTSERKTIVIQPIGTFTAEQDRVLRLVADYMKAFYGIPVRLEGKKPLGQVPKEMTRTQYPNNRQIRTTYFLDDVLPKMLPNDATAFICLTNFDLYPEETWNYVFGQATLQSRVGVWSLYRLGRQNGKPAEFNLLLDRALKIAVHETGHMFSMLHCTKYECLMSGSNGPEETDRRPLDVCPECMAKIAWAMHYDAAERYRNLAAFWQKQGRAKEEKEFLQKAAAIEAVKNE